MADGCSCGCHPGSRWCSNCLSSHNPPDVLAELLGSLKPLLWTSEQAAARLGEGITPGWLRRRATGRLIPCTFLGHFLRFSEQNLHDLVELGNQDVVGLATRVRSVR